MFVASDNTLYFSGFNGTDTVLYVLTDGSRTPVKKSGDISPANNGNFNELDGKIYFDADNGTDGAQLWVYDGSTASQVVVLIPDQSLRTL